MTMRPRHNPYRHGSRAHDRFDWLHSAHCHKSTAELEALRDRLREDAHNYCLYSWKQMSDFDFDADVIQDMISRRG
jgi:hypothetical protein